MRTCTREIIFASTLRARDTEQSMHSIPYTEAHSQRPSNPSIKPAASPELSLLNEEQE